MPDETPEKILIVDDDANVVAGIRRQFRKAFNITPATSGDEGLKRLKTEGPFAVVVSDFRMPGMDGIAFLAKVCEASPDSVRVILTGHADLDTAIHAVNQGHVFRFLTKPCDPDLFRRTLLAATAQYRLVTAERELLQRTLGGSIKVLTDILALASPAAFGRTVRTRERASRVAALLGVPDAWHVELAAMLSHIGCVAIRPETIEKVYQAKPLSPAETEVMERYPQIGHDLVANIPRLEKVAEIVAYQQKRYDGGGVPRDGVSGDEIPLGARILKAALDYDVLESSGLGRAEAFERLHERAGRYDPRVLAAFKELLSTEVEEEVWSVGLDDLRVGMVMVEDVRADTGLLVLARGQQMTEPLLQRLRHFAQDVGIKEPIRAYVPRNLEMPQETPAPAGPTS